MQIDATGRADAFAFGENWLRFQDVLDDERIALAERSLIEFLGVDGLQGRSFLDVGSGSGLFSLVAARLGAGSIHSFDADLQSAACTAALRDRYMPDVRRWTVERGDLTDRRYCESLGTFEIVYCWGVAHHTGAMSRALENLSLLVAPGGSLFVSIYNDQGHLSDVWRKIKKTYNRLPRPLRGPYAAAVIVPQQARSVLAAALRGKLRDYARSWTRPKRRGMSRWHDIVDWVGGYPFEVARPDEIVDFFAVRQFVLLRLRTVGRSHGCNQFVFRCDRPEA